MNFNENLPRQERESNRDPQNYYPGVLTINT